jgi:hypothetical protein
MENHNRNPTIQFSDFIFKVYKIHENLPNRLHTYIHKQICASYNKMTRILMSDSSNNKNYY